MKNQAYKLKSIFLPFLLIGIGTIVVYTFLNWLLFVKLNVFAVKEDVVNIFIPIFISTIPLLIWVNRKLKTLKLANKKGKSYDTLYFVVMMIAIGIPTIIAQKYMVAATGKLSALNNINDINAQPSTKYYSLKEYYIDKVHADVNAEATVEGKNNRDLVFRLFITLPIYKSIADTIQEPVAWLGKHYKKTISNSESDQKKDAEYKAFTEASQQSYDAEDFQQFTYLARVGNTDEHDGYLKTMQLAKRNTAAPVFEAEHEPFAARMGEEPFWLAITFGGGAILVLLMLLIPGVREVDETLFAKPDFGPAFTVTELPKKETDKWYSFFVPNKELFITPIIIDLNLIIFIIMVLSGAGAVSISSELLVKWGGNYGPLTKDGEWWRLLTSTFLHGGIMHLLMNMYALIFVGIFLEKSLNKGAYTMFYLLTGIIASTTSLWWHPDTVSIGASGAIMGMYGVFLALLLTKIYSPEFSKPFLASTALFVVFNLVAGLEGGVDNAAHIGGLVSGFVIGLLYAPYLKWKMSMAPPEEKLVPQEQVSEHHETPLP